MKPAGPFQINKEAQTGESDLYYYNNKLIQLALAWGFRDRKQAGMKEEYKRKYFEEMSLHYLRELELTALWLTKNHTESDYLIHRTLSKTYRIWHPCITKNNFKMLLFKILTKLYFDGVRQNSHSPIAKNVIDYGLKIPHNRLSLINNEYRIIAKREIVRLPVEARFVKFLSKIGRFSNLEIAKIIGIKGDKIKLESFGGSRFLRNGSFVYGEG